ncbi:MAG: tetratricopeptide repeat protein [Anaerolineales bacterium]|nr:tetratricopeptide repeat protein [Anaerolineales bacterium]
MAKKHKNTQPSVSIVRPVPWEWMVWVGLAFLAGLVYVNGIKGDFVYDDVRQITQNLLIQDPAYYGKALVSDVWAFKGNTDQAFSNYWRPTFIAWLIANVRAFGVQNSALWHVTNILLHIAITLTAFGWLRSLGVEVKFAVALAAIFAVHPSHVESVTWISGSPDLLMAWPLLGALWLTRGAVVSARGRWMKYGLALACGALAMLAKEVAVVVGALVFVLVMLDDYDPKRGWWGQMLDRQRLVRAVQWALPFLVLAGVYFAARYQVLKVVSKTNYGHVGPVEIFLTAPSLLTFYVRQALFPLWVGPNYPLRPVMPATMGVENFLLPVGIVIALVVFVIWALRSVIPRGVATTKGVFSPALPQIGLALFLLPLAPTFNILAFIPEHTVHDRYLYLPVLGFWMFLLPVGFTWLSERMKIPTLRLIQNVLLGALLICIPLSAQTLRYNTAWENELALWMWAIKTDPTSAFNWSQYANQLYKAGRVEEAKTAVDKALVSLTVSSAPDSLFLRARIATDEHRYQDAVSDLQVVLNNQPTNVPAYEQLAVVYQQQGDLNAAAQVLMEGRATNPANDCELSSNLAVLYYLGNEKELAQAELERIRPLTTTDFAPICRQALFFLGELYNELGRTAEAQGLYQEYLQATATFTDDTSLRYRQLAQQRLTP